jgi:hypothetical protein
MAHLKIAWKPSESNILCAPSMYAVCLTVHHSYPLSLALLYDVLITLFSYLFITCLVSTYIMQHGEKTELHSACVIMT